MKILIVEDDPMVRMINHRFLERIAELKDATVTESESAVAALDLPDLADYELVLLDMYLPQINGTQFLSELVQRQLHPQVIMMTAANDQQTLKEAVNYGVLDFLIKPFSFDRFQKAIDKYLKMMVVDHKTTVSQTDLDSLFLGDVTAVQSGGRKALPKGLSRLSLRKIVAALQEFPATFANQEVADHTGLSRVSTKKYLDFLAEIDYLNSEIVYQKSGRPLTKFAINQQQVQVIHDYL
ncbi:response regulator [Levilactobacillus cerevisiae]|uniref:response regulator n=1 Tax=Levilactobacillus cerevisiae TaxID=1704076 RepID=UPI000F77EA83|nr:response regulator [Levilactobacillus cerevisiae]